MFRGGRRDRGQAVGVWAMDGEELGSRSEQESNDAERFSVESAELRRLERQATTQLEALLKIGPTLQQKPETASVKDSIVRSSPEVESNRARASALTSEAQDRHMPLPSPVECNDSLKEAQVNDNDMSVPALNPRAEGAPPPSGGACRAQTIAACSPRLQSGGLTLPRNGSGSSWFKEKYMEQFDDNCDKLTWENNTYGRTLGSSLDKVAAFALANREIALSNRELAMGNRVAVAELRKESKSEMTYRDMAEEMVKKGIASGAYKVNFSFWTNIMNGLTAGAYISLGAYLSAFVGAGMPTISQGNPGLVKLIMALVFPCGLFMVVLTGGELITSSFSTVGPAILAGSFRGRGKTRRALLNLCLIYCMNFLGCLFVAALAIGCDSFAQEEYRVWFIRFAESKFNISWGTALLRGIVANWFVSMAVMFTFAAPDVLGKAVALWPLIVAFVALGMDHCVANMFYLSTGIFLGANYTFGAMIIHNLIPVTLGNFLGSQLCSLVYQVRYKQIRVFDKQKEQGAISPEDSAEKGLRTGGARGGTPPLSKIRATASSASAGVSTGFNGEGMEGGIFAKFVSRDSSSRLPPDEGRP